MVAILNRKFHVGDYVTHKSDGHATIYEIYLINHIKHYITVRIVYPIDLKTGTALYPYFTITDPWNDDFAILDKKVVEVLYGS